MMNVLVIGKGGREHALIRAFQNSKSVDHVYSFPHRAGFKATPLLEKEDLSASDLLPTLKQKNIHLIVIGPEKELVSGWSDTFREHGFEVFGPSKKASQLEGSKIFSKEFMKRAKVPTARYSIVQSVDEVMEQASQFSAPYVLKADGLAAGKGVFICSDLKELKENSIQLFEKKIFGDAGKKALLEEFHKGYELSVLVLTNGKDYQALPLAQDFKKRDEGNQGLNTGGMGAIAPIKKDLQLWKDIEKNIIGPTISQIQKEDLFYRGVLYIGLMISDEKGPQVLEYNVRFGDPECQILLPLINKDMGNLFSEVARGKISPLDFYNRYYCCVVLAEKGYPQNPQKGIEIPSQVHEKDLLNLTYDSNKYFLHCGTKREKDQWVVDGGRVLNAIGSGTSLEEARKKAYSLIDQLPNLSLYYRKDIGI